MANNIDLTDAFEVVQLARQALYEIEYLYIPANDSESNTDLFLKVLQTKLNFAKEAVSLLPTAISTIDSYIVKK